MTAHPLSFLPFRVRTALVSALTGDHAARSLRALNAVNVMDLEARRLPVPGFAALQRLRPRT